MNQRLKFFLQKLLAAERSPHKLAISSCVGLFVACSPFLGIQTFLGFLLSFMMRLNATVVILVLYLINNPITMIPIVVMDYAIGKLIFETWLHIDLRGITPAWLASIDTYFTHKIASFLPEATFCIWYYLLGGLLFALVCALVIPLVNAAKE
jgi:uncharacterized protein (DUF2062 family)